jgi:saccharopine dehydrogenase-like NADP-dependent oxidoreductase
MMKEHAAKVKVLEDKLVKTEKSVNQKVNESLTRIGVSVFPTENTLTNPSSSPSEIMVTFNGLQGGEKTVYYNKHKAELNKALGIA